MISRYILAILRKLHYEKLPDSLFLRIKYWLMTGHVLHLRHPKRFTEKIQWLKLYDRKPEYTMMVDKSAVKNYVSDKIGGKYVIPTIGVWTDAQDIEFEKLPSKFVLKTNNGGGSNSVLVCRDKSALDMNAVRCRFNNALNTSIYQFYREWPYKDVSPRIFAEQLIETNFGSDLPDYKFFCFNGEPEYCQVIRNRTKNETIDFFDKNWIHQDFCGLNPAVRCGGFVDKPINYDEMLSIASNLSQGIPFLRVDLYNVMGKIYFGELTFYPASGLGRFTPEVWDFILGSKICF